MCAPNNSFKIHEAQKLIDLKRNKQIHIYSWVDFFVPGTQFPLMITSYMSMVYLSKHTNKHRYNTVNKIPQFV
jgi:hypothetical protein